MNHLAPYDDVGLAAHLLAVDPAGLGGLALRAAHGPVAQSFLALLRNLAAQTVPFRRLPLHIADDRLIGGLDLAATLQTGRPALQRGLLADADGGFVTVAMAERMDKSLTARLTGALDTGDVVVARDGFETSHAARICVIALDEGANDEERPPAALLDRLALHLDCRNKPTDGISQPPAEFITIAQARRHLPGVTADDAILTALCHAAAAIGVSSSRAPLFALKAARAHAALCGRSAVAEDDIVVACRLVLAPRATMLPPMLEEEQSDDEDDDTEQSETESADGDSGEDESRDDTGNLDDIVLEATRAAIPSGLLSQLQHAASSRMRSPSSGRVGVARIAHRGRPIGSRRGELSCGARLSLIETLRNAAPWQTMRRKSSADAPAGRVLVRKEDFRIVRFKQRSETATIFVVDASGSSALHRLAEAKGAVELLLADCYVRRDQVALIAFRGRAAELILPPTRSLTRAKRTLSALPGGGGTPLATAIDHALLLADRLQHKGQSPTLVFLTDGRANVARNGAGGRDVAQAEAMEAARVCRGLRVAALWVDTSPSPSREAADLSAAMGARYLPLPRAGATSISHAVRASLPDAQTPSARTG